METPEEWQSADPLPSQAKGVKYRGTGPSASQQEIKRKWNMKGKAEGNKTGRKEFHRYQDLPEDRERKRANGGRCFYGNTTSSPAKQHWLRLYHRLRRADNT